MLEAVGLVFVALVWVALVREVLVAAVEGDFELIFTSKKVTSRVANNAITPRYCHNRLDNGLNDE